MAARLADLGAPPALVSRLVHIEALDGAVGVALLATEQRFDVAATAQAYTLIGEEIGLDWARGAAHALSPADPWERLLTASLIRDFEQIRLDLLRNVVPDGGDPVATIRQWLTREAVRVARISGAIARARSGGVVSPAMLAHIAGQARAALS
jgi:glutamate dehydrogenase